MLTRAQLPYLNCSDFTQFAVKAAKPYRKITMSQKRKATMAPLFK